MPRLASARRLFASVLAVAGLTCLMAMHAVAGEPSQAEIAARLHDLDNPRYEVRVRAQEQLSAWADEPDVAARLAVQCQQLLHATDTSYEVRQALESLSPRLPPVAQPPDVEPAEVDALVDQLDSDQYAERTGAMARLEWLLQRDALAGPIMTRLKQRLARDDVAVTMREQIEPLYRRARGVWLLSDPQVWNLPAIEPGAVERWLDTLVDATASDVARQDAEYELLDALARDDVMPHVREALLQRLADDTLTPEVRERLQRAFDWTRPAMVAEVWNNGRHSAIQHLLIGVPSKAPGAERASHFDRIDDVTAHCVSGHSLSPGDYPVGVLFPHPRLPEGQFRLVNLSTPRKRMQYEYYCRTDEATRWAAISRDTCDVLASTKTRLSKRAIEMLTHLDPQSVSRFAAKFMLDVDDGPLDLPNDRLGPISHHGYLCCVLAMLGTRDALPDLRRAIAKDRVTAPTDDAPYNLPWCAVLAIAARHPDAADNAWLSELLARDTPLIATEDLKGPTLGASVAALLIETHGQSPVAFGLEELEDEILDQFGCPSYAYGPGDSKERVRRWWSRQSSGVARALSP